MYATTIQGDNLEKENIIKIEIVEKKLESNSMGKGKNKKRGKIKSIVPSLPYTRENITKIASKRISEIFYDLMDYI